MCIGERIKEARKAAGLTQKELGERLGVSDSSIAQYESGLRNPKYETLKKIAAVLDVNINKLNPNYISRPWSDFKLDLKAASETKDELFTLIGFWTAYQARKRLPVIKAIQELEEDELSEVLTFISFLISKKSSDSGDSDKQNFQHTPAIRDQEKEANPNE